MLFKSLDYIIKNVLIEKNELNDNNYVRYLQIAVMGAREANFGLPINLKTVMLEYDHKKRYVDFPKDCVEYTKIGIVRGDKVVLLGLNPKLANSRHYNACGMITPLPGRGEQNDIFPMNDIPFYNYFYNYEYGAIYGFGPGSSNVGEYNYDNELNRLTLGPGIQSHHIYLEYKSNGISADGAVLVPEELIQELVEWVHWRISLFSNEETVYQKERTRKNYIAAKKNTRIKMSPSLQEYYDFTFQGYTQSPK